MATVQRTAFLKYKLCRYVEIQSSQLPLFRDNIFLTIYLVIQQIVRHIWIPIKIKIPYYYSSFYLFFKIIMHQLVKLTDAIWLLQLVISFPAIHALGDPS